MHYSYIKRLGSCGTWPLLVGCLTAVTVDGEAGSNGKLIEGVGTELCDGGVGCLEGGVLTALRNSLILITMSKTMCSPCFAMEYTTRPAIFNDVSKDDIAKMESVRCL